MEIIDETLIEKAKSILCGIEIGNFITSKKWTKDNYVDYYQYFSRTDFDPQKIFQCKKVDSL